MRKIASVPFMYEWYLMAKSFKDDERLALYDAILGIIYEDDCDIISLTKPVQAAIKMLMPQIKREIGKVAASSESDVRKEKDTAFEECWVAYRRKGSKKKAKEYWVKLKENEKAMVMPHIKAYTASREIVYQKDFERYLRDKTFNTLVIQGNKVVFDPTKNTYDDSYTPQGHGIWFEESVGQYMSMDSFYGYVYDGYTDETRPDGATIVLNNGRGKIVWNRDCKQWNNM